jgi:hypothetical protein
MDDRTEGRNKYNSSAEEREREREREREGKSFEDPE